jgi:hypothetical protein
MLDGDSQLTYSLSLGCQTYGMAKQAKSFPAPDLPIGSSVAPAIPFTYQIPRNFPVTQDNCGPLLNSMRKAAELLQHSGRLNELRTQLGAIRAVEANCRFNGWMNNNIER